MLRVELDGIIYSLQEIGGISVYHSELLKNASQDVSYLTSLPNGTHISPALLDFQKHQIALRRYPSRKIERIRRFVPNAAFRPQVVHTTYYRTLSGSFVPLVVTAHDFIVETFGPKNFRQRLHMIQKENALRKASKIIAISESTRTDLEALYGSRIADKVTVVRNGISDAFRCTDGSQRHNQNVFIGSRAAYKGFDIAIETVARLADMRLLIVGGGPLSNTERMLLEARLSGRFEHLGYVSQETLVQIYNESLFLLYPSLYEGFGIPPIEAARCGCIPVVFDISSLPEVVGTKETILPLGTAPADIAAHLAAISPAEVETIRASGIAFSQDFSWQKCAQDTERVLRSATI